MIYNKFRVESHRGKLIDEWHDGVFCKIDSQERTDIGEGCNDIFYLRSCAKPLQATLLSDNKIDLTEKELAFCCGSHAGEVCHIKVAESILKKIGLNETNLKCGIHAPLSRSMQDRMLMQGENPSQLHNNCSGKHIGFLAICKKNNWDLKTYDSPEHPLQKEIKGKIHELCEIPLNSNYPVTTDGCGVPILSMPLKNMVKGYINLLKYPKIIEAIKNNPYIFGGENRTDTEIIQKTDNIIAKVGAGGLCIVLNIKEKSAFGIKINDCSMEARRIALFEIINELGWGKIEFDNSIKTISGKNVGSFKVVYEK